jgi:O-antigen/teichoic acid export membrane protein
LGFLFFGISHILRPLLLALDRPHIVTYIDVVSVIAMFIGCYAFIPLKGVLAPAITAFVVNGCAMVYYAVYTIRHIHKIDVFIEPDDVSTITDYNST